MTTRPTRPHDHCNFSTGTLHGHQCQLRHQRGGVAVVADVLDLFVGASLDQNPDPCPDTYVGQHVDTYIECQKKHPTTRREEVDREYYLNHDTSYYSDYYADFYTGNPNPRPSSDGEFFVSANPKEQITKENEKEWKKGEQHQSKR